MNKINLEYLHKIYMYKIRTCGKCGKEYNLIDNIKNCKCVNRKNKKFCVIL